MDFTALNMSDPEAVRTALQREKANHDAALDHAWTMIMAALVFFMQVHRHFRNRDSGNVFHHLMAM